MIAPDPPEVALQNALANAGLHARVSADGRLAVLFIAGDSYWPKHADSRRRAAALAREHGFTHLALELTSDGAALPRD